MYDFISVIDMTPAINHEFYVAFVTDYSLICFYYEHAGFKNNHICIIVTSSNKINIFF